MVYRRRRYGRKRYTKFSNKSRTVTMGGGKTQLVHYKTVPQTKVHFFKRTSLKLIDLNPATIGRISYWANSGWTGPGTDDEFRLSYLTNVSEFTNLFDMYKITGVRMKFIYDRNSAQGSIASESLPTLYFYNDYDDGTPAANVGDACQYDSLRMKRMDRPITFFVRPKIQSMVYESAITTAYATPKKNPWLDCGNDAIPHYGCKWIIDANSAFASSIGTVTVMMTYYIACKDVR